MSAIDSLVPALLQSCNDEPGRERLCALQMLDRMAVPRGLPRFNQINDLPGPTLANRPMKYHKNLGQCPTECPLSGVKRTWRLHRKMSAFDPKRTTYFHRTWFHSRRRECSEEWRWRTAKITMSRRRQSITKLTCLSETKSFVN
jgi:hypothetical protein